MKRKYLKGMPIISIMQFMVQAEMKRPIFYRHKVETFGWYQNWSLHLILMDMRRGYLFEAIPTSFIPKTKD
jgi:hypothetical protein